MASSIIVPFISYPDITDCILMHLPNLQSLRSTILTSKAVFAVFQAHRQSIIRAVTANEFGPAFKQAFRLVKTLNSYQGLGRGLSDDDEYTKIEAHEALTLTENARVAHELESLYSLCEKDQTSKTSRLSPLESMRFQRALYRLWIYTRLLIIQPHNYNEEEEEEEESDGDSTDDGDYEFGCLEHEAFLLQLNDKEIKEVAEIHTFFRGLVHWIVVSRSIISHDAAMVDWWLNLLLVKGPAEILDFFNISIARQLADLTFLEPTIYMRNTPFDAGIRKAKNLTTSDGLQSAILADITECDMDSCAFCTAAQGPKLYNSTNWEWIKGLITEEINVFLPGELPRNLWESNALCSVVKSTGYVSMLHSMFSSRKEIYAGVDESSWLCLDCVKAFIRGHLMEWWLENKQTSGATWDPVPDKNCWYGYKCNTQTHKRSHATRLNHLCPPTPRERT